MKKHGKTGEATKQLLVAPVGMRVCMRAFLGILLLDSIRISGVYSAAFFVIRTKWMQ